MLNSRNFLEARQKVPAGKNLNLTSMLITPVQRLPRIILLLHELEKYTVDEHPDYEDIRKAVDVMQDVVRGMNNIIKAAENTDKILKIQKSFGDSFVLLEPSRVFLREGAATLLSSKKKPVNIFLFSDLLIVARKSSGESHILEDRISLGSAAVPAPNDFGSTLDMTTSTGKCTLIFGTTDERNSWCKLISIQIKSVLEKEGQSTNAREMTKRTRAIISKESVARFSHIRKNSF